MIIEEIKKLVPNPPTTKEELEKLPLKTLSDLIYDVYGWRAHRAISPILESDRERLIRCLLERLPMSQLFDPEGKYPRFKENKDVLY